MQSHLSQKSESVYHPLRSSERAAYPSINKAHKRRGRLEIYFSSLSEHRVRRVDIFVIVDIVCELTMSESHLNEYDHYNYEVDKHVHSGHSGKQRSKKEASEHTNHFDPSGHSRKIVTKLQNTEQNRKLENTATTTSTASKAK